MSSLSFPDLNVWMAVTRQDHIHRALALDWWETDHSDVIAFTRFTQLGFLRLVTTAAVMNNRPLTMPQAWKIYDALFQDERVAFMEEPRGIEPRLRRFTSEPLSSPKLWMDAYLLAFVERVGGTIVTFDRPLAARSNQAILLA